MTKLRVGLAFLGHVMARGDVTQCADLYQNRGFSPYRPSSCPYRPSSCPYRPSSSPYRPPSQGSHIFPSNSSPDTGVGEYLLQLLFDEEMYNLVREEGKKNCQGNGRANEIKIKPGLSNTYDLKILVLVKCTVPKINLFDEIQTR